LGIQAKLSKKRTPFPPDHIEEQFGNFSFSRRFLWHFMAPEPKPLSAACQLFWAMAIAHWQRYSGILQAFVSIAGL